MGQIAARSNRGISDVRDGLDRCSVLFDAKTAPCQHLFVDAGMQLGETVRKLDILAIGHDRAIGSLSLRALGGRHVIHI